MSEDIVDDTWDTTRRVDIDADGKIFPGMMVAEHQRPFGRLEARLIWPPIQSSVQGLNVYIEHENLVEKVQEFVEIARAATEEGGRMGGVGSNSADLVDTPDPVGVSPNDAIRACGWSCECLARLGVADIGQDPVTMDDMVASPLQFGSDRRFPSAGTAFDQIVLDSHRRRLSWPSVRRHSTWERFANEMTAGLIPGWRCAVLRVLGNTDNREPAALFLYRDWLPAGGEEPRDSPLYCQRLAFFPEVPEHETVAELFLPLEQPAGRRLAASDRRKRTGRCPRRA